MQARGQAREGRRKLTSTAKPAARRSCRIRSVLLSLSAPVCGALAAAMPGCIVAAMLSWVVVCVFRVAENAGHAEKMNFLPAFPSHTPHTSELQIASLRPQKMFQMHFKSLYIDQTAWRARIWPFMAFMRMLISVYSQSHLPLRSAQRYN